MSATAGLMLGWNRTIPGLEAESNSKFPEFGGYLAKLQASGQIESFEPVFTSPHGGDLNGFFLIRADQAKLNALEQSDQWKDWIAWGSYHLMGFGVVHCMFGAEI